MKLPRDVSGDELAKHLKVFGYTPTRQSGSHLRLTTLERGEHRVSIPLHESLKIGTLAGILSDVAKHFELSRDEILARLFGE